MTKKKKRWIIFGAIFGGVLAIVEIIIVLTFPWNMLYLGLIKEEDPPLPEITYAEFPFEIVCEIDGKDVIINDTYICEYDGIGINESRGKYVKWRGYMKSTGSGNVFIKSVDGATVYCSVGSPLYYMNDPRSVAASHNPTFYSINDQSGYVHGLDEQELSEYGIKLISYKLSDPIENSFGEEQE